MNKKPKPVKKFRVVCGGVYCSLRTDFDALGTVHPDTTQAAAHVFNSSVMANNCIGRVYEKRKEVSASLYPDHPIFKPLFFDGIPEVEEFEVQP